MVRYFHVLKVKVSFSFKMSSIMQKQAGNERWMLLMLRAAAIAITTDTTPAAPPARGGARLAAR